MKRRVILLPLILIVLTSLSVSCTNQKVVSNTKQQGSVVPEELVTEAKDFVGLLASEDYHGAVKKFDTTMQREFPEEKLKKVWESTIAQVGLFEKQMGVWTEKEKGYDIVFVASKFKKSTLDIKVVFNNEKRIVGLFFVPGQPGSK